MELSQKLGRLVVLGVPVIVGGGITYAIFGSFTAMFTYEALLLLVAGAYVSS